MEFGASMHPLVMSSHGFKLSACISICVKGGELHTSEMQEGLSELYSCRLEHCVRCTGKAYKNDMSVATTAVSSSFFFSYFKLLILYWG